MERWLSRNFSQLRNSLFAEARSIPFQTTDDCRTSGKTKTRELRCVCMWVYMYILLIMYKCVCCVYFDIYIYCIYIIHSILCAELRYMCRTISSHHI